MQLETSFADLLRRQVRKLNYAETLLVYDAAKEEGNKEQTKELEHLLRSKRWAMYQRHETV
jgi:hypothetical protein